MITRIYTLEFVVQAENEAELPTPHGLARGIVDGLPKEWFTFADGDEYVLIRVEPILED